MMLLDRPIVALLASSTLFDVHIQTLFQARQSFACAHPLFGALCPSENMIASTT